MNRLEGKWYRPVFEALDKQYQSVAREMKRNGVPAALKMRLPEDQITAVIRDMYEEVGALGARITMMQISDSEIKAGFGVSQAMIDSILEYLMTHYLSKVVREISETTRSEIQKIIELGYTEGWGIDRMAREIIASDSPLWRTRMIVRTELVMAIHAGKQAAKDESNFETEDIWLSVHDARTRNTHRLMDKKKVPEGQKFAVPKRKGGYDMMTGPGDPEASAENVINCRCTSVTRAKRDASGRLIRKRKISVILPGEIRRPQVITV